MFGEPQCKVCSMPARRAFRVRPATGVGPSAAWVRFAGRGDVRAPSCTADDTRLPWHREHTVQRSSTDVPAGSTIIDVRRRAEDHFCVCNHATASIAALPARWLPGIAPVTAARNTLAIMGIGIQRQRSNWRERDSVEIFSQPLRILREHIASPHVLRLRSCSVNQRTSHGSIWNCSFYLSESPARELGNCREIHL